MGREGTDTGERGEDRRNGEGWKMVGGQAIPIG
jgi:hypothetical protein